MKYKKLVKHKRKPRKVTKAFSKNSERTVFTYTDGSTLNQSHLSGKYVHRNKKGKALKTFKN